MHATTIIQCLKRHGQLLDSKIAAETGIPLDALRFSQAGLAECGEYPAAASPATTKASPSKASFAAYPAMCRGRRLAGSRRPGTKTRQLPAAPAGKAMTP